MVHRGLATPEEITQFLLEGAESITESEIIQPERIISEEEIILGELHVGWQRLYTYCRRLTLIIVNSCHEPGIFPHKLLESSEDLWLTFDLLMQDEFGLRGNLWPAPRKGFFVAGLPEREPHWIHVVTF